MHGRYNYAVWMAVTLNSMGGLIVAMVVKYADNVIKGFATSTSSVLTALVSCCFYYHGGDNPAHNRPWKFRALGTVEVSSMSSELVLIVITVSRKVPVSSDNFFSALWLN